MRFLFFSCSQRSGSRQVGDCNLHDEEAADVRFCKDCYTPHRDYELYCRKCSGKLYRRVKPYETFDLLPRLHSKRRHA